MTTVVIYDRALSSARVTDPDGFGAGRNPAVEAVAFPKDVHQVDILKIGRSRVILPHGKRWDELFENGPRASRDFMVDRQKPSAEEREPKRRPDYRHQ